MEYGLTVSYINKTNRMYPCRLFGQTRGFLVFKSWLSPRYLTASGAVPVVLLVISLHNHNHSHYRIRLNDRWTTRLCTRHSAIVGTTRQFIKIKMCMNRWKQRIATVAVSSIWCQLWHMVLVARHWDFLTHHILKRGSLCESFERHCRIYTCQDASRAGITGEDFQDFSVQHWTLGSSKEFSFSV